MPQSTKIIVDTNALINQAKEMGQSFMKSDFSTFMKYTYPKVIQMMGGKSKMTTLLKQGLAKMKSDGYEFKSLDIELTSLFVTAGSELHSLVRQRIVMTVPGGTLLTDSYLLAITLNTGKDWFFVDTAPLHDKNTLTSLFPNYNQELKIPRKQPPVFNEQR